MLFSIASIMTVCLIVNTTQTNAQRNDEEAIKQTLRQETSSYFQKDYDSGANNWTHDSADYIIRADASVQSQLMGWKAISNKYKQSIQNSSVMDDASIVPFLNKKDFHFYINGNVALVSFNQGDILPNFETRTLIKQNGV